MQITEVRLRKMTKDSRLKAIASITFDNEFVIHDVKVIEKEKEDGVELFVAMPSKKNPVSGEFKDIAHPINADARKKIVDAVMEKYNNPDEESAE
ncbi:MAG: septation regulator SpoVG [Clostridiales bacterium]|nr:septation regulator SpoVG [Clostridiales bacterium]